MPAEINFDITRLTDRQRRTVFARLRIVEQWERAASGARERGTTRRRLAGPFVRRVRRRGVPLSFRTLQLWQSEYRAAGLLGLVDQRWLGGLRRRAERQRQLWPFFGELTRRYTGPGLLSVAMCHDLATQWAEQHGCHAATRRESWCYLRANILPRLTTEPGAVRRPDKGRSNDI
jgi:hypothetical protein